MRITVWGDAIELLGYLDVEDDELREFTHAMAPFGIVIVSPVEDDRDPSRPVPA